MVTLHYIFLEFLANQALLMYCCEIVKFMLWTEENSNSLHL